MDHAEVIEQKGCEASLDADLVLFNRTVTRQDTPDPDVPLTVSFIAFVRYIRVSPSHFRIRGWATWSLSRPIYAAPAQGAFAGSTVGPRVSQPVNERRPPEGSDHTA